MMRSIAESMESSLELILRSVRLFLRVPHRLELRDRLVGEAEPVVLAAMKHLHDDLERAVVGDEGVGNGAGPAQVIGGDGVGIADRLDVHHLQAALDQHVPVSEICMDKAQLRTRFPYTKLLLALKRK